MNTENQFRFPPHAIAPGTGLIMMNYPHNPSGQVASEKWLRQVCQHCSDNDIRLFNDAAYIILSHGPDSVSLSQVAPDYPELSWAEAFTAAKLIGNGTGWHVGAMVGSPDFIGDIKEVKGKTDAGFVAPMAAGVVAAFEDDQEGYRPLPGDVPVPAGRSDTGVERTGNETRAGTGGGILHPMAGSEQGVGRKVESAERFNFMMIEETGVVGVHFPGYVRYAVCADVEAMAADIEAAFARAQVSYD